MIQRVQSLFLLLVSVISGVLLLVPVYELHDLTLQVPASAPKSFNISDNALLMILNMSTGGLALFGIFLYKWRNLQIRISNIGLLLSCVLIGLLFFVADAMSSTLNQKVEYKYGTYLPLIQLIFFFLAARFVKKDEELVRSADRLR